MMATVSACFRHCMTAPQISIKTFSGYAARLRVAGALRKAGIREQGADCLKREGVRCFKGDIKQNVRSTFRKREGASLENRFSESAPHLFLKPRPTDALLDILYIKFSFSRPQVSGLALLFMTAGKVCAIRQVCEGSRCVFTGTAVQISDGTGGDL